ncbi:MAG TPA: hypothetical protein VGY13_12245 [Solirubrobacteraceae bacterium]|jgi:hypothetical protein|nr:hypothetical protein [Solirubrobacteraceae bacterium]
MSLITSILRRQGVLIAIASLAASDVAYRALLREPVRRAIGVSRR